MQPDDSPAPRTASSATPVVSVVVTTFNQAPYLAEAIQSVLDQEHRPDEIIVVDDGSTDETPEVAASFGDAIRYIRQTNRGVAGSRNRGVEESKGELVAFLDGDDRWAPRKLLLQIEAIRQSPGTGLIAVDGVQFDEHGVRKRFLLDRRIRERFRGRAIFTSDCYLELLRGNVISTTSEVLIPRRVLDAVGPSDPRFPVCSDYDLYLRIARRYPFTFVAQHLVEWRYLSHSASGPESLRRLRWSEDVLEILERHANDGERQGYRREATEAMARLISLIAREAYHYGIDRDRVWARGYLRQLVRRFPVYPPLYAALGALYLPRKVKGRLASWISRRVG